MAQLNINKRQQKRLPARPLAPYGNPRTPPYRILDISCSGCLVQSSKPFGRVASIVTLELPVPSKEEFCVIRAKIVWERVGPDRGGEGDFRYGLSFREMDKASRTALNLYLDYLKRDHHLSQLDEAWRKARTPRHEDSTSILGEEPEGVSPSVSEGPVKGRNDSGNAFVR